MNKYFDLTIGADHPLVAHHRVQGQAVLPGLAYIDLLLRVARDGLGLDCLHTQLRDLVIYQPLLVPAGSALRLTLTLQAQDGAWAVDVDGVPLRDNAVAGERVKYCTAQLHPASPEAGAKPDLDLAALKAQADGRVPLAQLYAQARQRELVHDGLLLAEGSVQRFAWGCLIELGVAPQWRQSMPDALFHPTLIDGAAVASAVLEDQLPADDGLYLPLHYGSFQARALLQEACVARVELGRIATANDIRKLDIDFYDLAGRWVASLGELTGKRVRATLGAVASPAPNSPQPAKAQSDDVAPEILAVFARHLQTRPDQVDPRRGFFDMGLSSAQMLTILKEIEGLLARRLNPTLLFEHNTLEELLTHIRELAPQLATRPAAPVPTRQPQAAAYRFAADEAYLQDHRVNGQPALMGITYPSLVLQTALAGAAQLPLSLQDIRFQGGPLKLRAGQIAEVEVRLPADGGGRFSVHQQLAGEGAGLCCEGLVHAPDTPEPAALDLKALIAAARPYSAQQIDSWYRTVPAFALGPMLKTLVAAYEGADGSLICEVELPATGRRFVDGLALDPLLLNSCYLFPVPGPSSEGSAATFVPLLLERLTLWRDAGRKAFVVTGPKRVKDGFIAFDSLIVDAQGRALASLDNASLRRLEPAVAARADAPSSPAPGPAAGGQRIAVIGMAGRFPQAYDLDGFWQNLQAGQDCIGEIPASRWDWRDYYSDSGEPGTISSKWGGFIEDATSFDPLFFQISPREAEVMDPLERLFLQHAWMAMEDAGYTREALQRNTARDGAANVGIYAGVMGQEYPLFAAQSAAAVGLGGGTSSVATRMAYVGNFNGPAMAIDTMCSSSLVALDMACQALRSGAVNAAFAGGVNLSLHPGKYLMLSQGRFISAKGHCESFGEGGDGYIPGEGVGVLLLKRLEDAERDGDFIHGVIRGTAVNHGGRASGYTVPNPSAQTQVIRQALLRAAVSADEISYIEAHGTGTKLGDPIEISGLTKAFEHDPAQPRETPCLIGSVKSNIGHCEGAAGVAGVIKVLLQMRHQLIVPSLHSRTLNPNIDFSLTPFQVNQQLQPWPAKGGQGRRIAGISSFGAGGVNAHAVVEDYPLAVTQARPAAACLILLSARDASRLPLMAGNLLAAIERLQLSDDALPSLAYTLQVGREAMEHRAATVVGDLEQLKERLHSLAASAVDPHWQRGVASQGKDTQDLYRDEDARQLLQTWLDKANLAVLARVWVLGVAAPWAQLYGPGQGFERPPRRLPLPTYPFKTERYWLAELAAGGARPAALEPALPTVHSGLFEQHWLPRAATASAAAHSHEQGFVLIICTAATQALAERLAAGLDAARIVPIDELAEHAQALCQPNGHGLFGVLDITGCDPAFVERCTTDLEGWFEGVQRLVEQTRLRDIRLLYVSRYLEAFQRPPSLAPAAQAALPACLYRCLGAEYQRLRSSHMDTDLAADDPLLVAQIIEQMYREPHERHACYRAGQAYVPALQALAPVNGAQSFSLPGDRVLWVTGGTRGLGLLCARHFVNRHGVRKLVLSGREALPPAEQWPALLSGPASPLRDKLSALHALQQQGVELLTLAVDMNDAQAMQQAVARIGRELGPVAGVIHCAGLGDYDHPALIRKPLAAVRKVLAPKTHGLDNLYQALRGSPLALFVLYSSVSAQLPELAAGQIDYAMANAYMDAFAAQHQADRVLSLQWPSWSDTGMGAMDSELYRGSGLLGLSDQDGLALLDLALASGRSGVLLPACFDPELWLQAPIAETLIPGAALEAEVQHWLGGLFCAELRIAAADFDPSLDFANYGLDSILMAQILRNINRRLKVELAPSLILEQPNLADLSQWLLTHQRPALEQAFAAAPAPQMPPLAVAAPAPQPQVQSAQAAPVARAAEADEIVVVGMSARFPGASSLDDYWRLLKEGRSALAPVPSRRWPHGGHYLAGTLEHHDLFDRQTFHIPEEDFHAMDPQALLVLEECLNLWAHAGYRVEETRGSAIGVYLGGRARSSLDPEALGKARNPIVVAGQNYLAANLSHFFDFSGPSMVIDTACSSALVGMGMAVQALRSGEIDAAVVGGVSLLDGERTHGLFQQRGLLSGGAQFHLFDERADGIVLAEGVGLVLLKTAARARQDGDTVYARLSALASNNDGRTAGPATPNVQRQKAVMGKALGQSGLTPGQIDYIEVNGSGSQVTDLLELKAIDAVYGLGAGAGHSPESPCGLGSIKPNIGHPLCAEGIASFIKAVLMIQHRSLVPFLSGQQPLRHFDLERSAFYFPRNAVALPAGQPLRIALNCFADGGNNVHAILQSPETPATPARRQPLAAPILHRQCQGQAPAATLKPIPLARDRANATSMIWEQL